ncbi:MAG TPA: heme ABC transporter ATP-binding protein CcmA [Legionella sp.]|nr:heme ABC transporter ATP-binding protein CcmA [Legionella sp.]
MQPAVGDIRYDGESIAKNRAGYQQALCYVGHKSGVSPLLTVRENVRYSVHAPSTVAFHALIKRFGLTGWEDVPCGLLSQGTRRRVGLLRLLMAASSLWLLDEPLVALDQEAVLMLMDCFREHLDKGGMIILTSHQPVPLYDRLCLDYCL